MPAALLTHIRGLLTQAAHHRPRAGTAVVVIALLVVVTTAVRWRLDRYLGPQLPFMLYLPAIIVATAGFGFRAGLATVLVSVALALYLWLSPDWQGAVVDLAALWSLASWLVVSVMLVTTIALLQQSTRTESQIAADLREKTERLRESEAKLAAHSLNLEQAVAERTSRLAETIAELESFSYTVSHDLRSPLRSMQGFAEILRADHGDRLDDTARMLLQRIDEGAQRMDRLVRDVLAYSGAGRTQYETSSLDLHSVMRTLLAEHPEIAAAATIEVVRPLHPVVGHLAALSQALSQLLANAVKFVDSARRPHIRIWTEQRTGIVRVNIQDNGIGIPENAITHLFKPFHRAHPAAAYPGTGIGLAIVKRVIERQAGSVGVQSHPGNGSVFWIELPAALADERLSA